MKFKFACPKCEKSIKATSEMAGKVAKCPSCGAKLRVPTPKPASAGAAKTRAPAAKAKTKTKAAKPQPQPAADSLPFDDDEWDKALNPFEAPAAEDTGAKLHNYDDPKKLSRKSLRWARRGLKMVSAGLSIIVVLALGAFAMVALIYLAREAAAPVATVLVIVGMLAYLVAALLLFIGTIFCAFVPEKTGAKQAAIQSVAAMVLGTLMPVVQAAYKPEDPVELMVLGLLTAGAGGFSYFSFLLFVKRVAKFVGRTDVEDRANVAMTAGVVVAACYVGLLVMKEAGGVFEGFEWVGGLIAIALSLVILVAGLLAFVKYVLAVSNLSQAL